MLRQHCDLIFLQEAVLDNDVGETVVVETPDTDGAGAATVDPEAERQREEAKQRQGALLRDKTLACAKQVREIQVKMTAGVEDLAKARAECLLVKRSILLKKQELTILLEEEIRVLEIEALLQKRVSGLEEARTVSWMGCVDGMTSLASHLTNTTIFPGGDVRGEQLARVDARVAMDKARLAVSKEAPVKPYSQAVKEVRQQADKVVVAKERKASQPAPELPKKAPVSSGGRTAREEEQWKTAGGRRAPVQTRHGRKQLLLHKDAIPPAEKFRYLS